MLDNDAPSFRLPEAEAAPTDGRYTVKFLQVPAILCPHPPPLHSLIATAITIRKKKRIHGALVYVNQNYGVEIG